MRINNNLGAMNTYSRLTSTNSLKEKSLEKLSSGLRINRAADDAAGLAISEKMRSQIKGLNQASRNAQDGISLIQTAEGGLSETHSMLQRMRELSVQASNDTLQAEDRTAIQTELDSLVEEIDRVANNTEFNGKSLLNGTMGVQFDASSTIEDTASNVAGDHITFDISGMAASETATFALSGNDIEVTKGGVTQTITVGDITSVSGTLNFDKIGVKMSIVGTKNLTGLAGTVKTGANDATKLQIGADSGQSLDLTIDSMTTAALNVETADVDVSTNAKANTAIDNIDAAIKTVSTQRAKLGANQNRLEHTMNNLQTSSENMTAAESRIRDVDMAKEMMTFTKNNILSQAATSMLAQANQSSQGVLQLLR